MTVPLDQLEQGDLCTFQYKQQSGNGQWYEWECTAVYIGRKTVQFPGGEVEISYRPKAGSSSIPIRDIMKVSRLKAAASRRGQISRDVDPGIVLPKRRKGAVSPP